MKDLEKIVQELEEKISTSLREGETEQDIEKVRINYLTRQGPLAQLMNRLKVMDVKQKEFLVHCLMIYEKSVRGI